MQNQKKSRIFNFCILHFSFCNGALVLALFLSLWIAPPALATQTGLEEQARQIAAELRCPVCQNLSAADSPSELAQQMRAIILQQLKEGKSPDQIKAYFVSKYGEWVLLAPTAKGFGLLIWVLPYVAVVGGIVLVLYVVRRWSRKKDRLQPPLIDPSLIERVRREAAADSSLPVDLESDSPGSLLLQEQARLYADLRELEFDRSAGKLSGDDYQELRQKLENEAAMVLKKLEASPTRRPGSKAQGGGKKPTPTEGKTVRRQLASRPAWQLAAGGTFLLLFGVTLGVLLTKSLRPRGSEQDTITGDFLTGTGPRGGGDASGTAGKDLPTLLAQGRTAFERQEYPRAIEAFKKALAIDANQPEAHTYMGLMLAQAGHADGALLAFDRALSIDPKFPLALWGKGMLLYQSKQDYAGARKALEKLSAQMPAGEEKNQIQKTVAEIAELGSRQKESAKQSKAGSPAPQTQQISGTISVDPKIQSKWDAQAVLFIIAHRADSKAGPPLAVKKIERPVFPLAYSLGSENVMMQGTPFSGKVLLSARLDKDGNPMTNEAGNLLGEYKKNPVEIGSQHVDVVLDRVM